MASTVTIDLRHVARGLEVPLRQIQTVVELLDEGNTVPFITRYRKDQTGGLDEEQIREIQSRLTKMRLLAERKQTILRSIDAQGKLTEKLARQIQTATTTKRLEDLYLPYKPKKQTLATLARSRGLEELAKEILEASPSCNDLDARARDFANPDRQIPSGADALLGAGHILAEQFSERADLRQRLREILQRSGKMVSTQIGGETPAVGEAARRPAAAENVVEPSPTVLPAASAEAVVVETGVENAVAPASDAENTADPVAVDPVAVEPPSVLQASNEVPGDAIEPTDHPPVVLGAPAGSPSSVEPPLNATRLDKPAVAPVASTAPGSMVAQPRRARGGRNAAKLSQKELKKKRADEMKIKAFRDYFNYSEELRKIPPHRTLAINRGERAKVLRIRIESDLAAMYAVLDELLVPPGHPHADYLRGCARDSLSRLILPGLEREVRRELTDRAELHAVGVFAKNLRNLLLQPPVRNRRVLAVDPGFKSGCKLAALDEFGNMLAQDVIYLIGKPERRQEAQSKVLDLVRRFQLSVVAIGNGTACRESEDFFAALVGGELKEQGVAFVIVNEAGASVYSTSQLGREEFPAYDATLRGAISIGRRLQDPLSELVKIDPASIGVGLYQHDVKAKHLRTSLDEVVESCVNYVGVDVNTASPALLRYVSGLNQLTARRMYEFRRERGPFRNREQLREVPGFGEATFVQAAGFLKITGGDHPLDVTWIHPESYAVAARVMERLGCTPAALTEKESIVALAQKVAGVDIEAMAKELEVGTLTLKDILAQLARPGRDPREDLPAPVFKQGVLKLEDLTTGMELTGTILNVVDFGSFVDIGMHDSGLVHVSHMADRYIRDPHEVVAVGDIVKVWVLAVDKERRRVSLTMVQPGSERPRHPRYGEKPAEGAEASPQDNQRGPQRRPFRRRGDAPAAGPAGGQAAPQGAPRSGQQGGQPGGQQGGQQGGRRPRPQGGPQQSGPRPSRPPQSRPPSRPQQPKPRPKPLVPLTEGMKAGKEPMRTFGDLAQFFETTKAPAAKAAKSPAGESTPASTTPASTAPVSPPVVEEARRCAEHGVTPPVETPPAAQEVATAAEPLAADAAPGVDGQGGETCP